MDIKTRRSFSLSPPLLWTGVCLLVLACVWSSETLAGFGIPISSTTVGQQAETNDDEDFAGGASLKTDPELEQFLRKADQFAADERYDLACILWQRVLDESSGTVMTRDDWTKKTSRRMYRRYRSVAGEIEQTIAKLPPAGLRTYRLTADGEAKALLAQAQGDGAEEALTQVTSRYFLSSYGDDAAYRLGCLRMDRYDFVGASRLFSKVLKEYPDTNIAKDELQLRLAVASARVGDGESAQAALADLRKTEADVSARLVKLVEADLAREGVDKPLLASAADGWPMMHGNASRTGYMKALPGAVTSTTMSELWTQQFDIALGSAGSDQPYQVYEELEKLRRSRLPIAQDTAAPNRDQLISRWKQNGWTPTGEMLLSHGSVYYKASDRVVCRNMQTGELVWMGRNNKFQMDQLSNLYMQRGQQLGLPNNPTEVMLFGDRIHQGMAISDGWLFNIEGPLVDDFGSSTPSPNINGRQRFGYNGGIARARRNFLAAYDATNGKLRWHRSAGDDQVAADEESLSKFDVGFLSAPVPFARFLLVPVIDGGSLWVYALEKKTGETAWKSFLCDDPTSGASPWSPVALAVDGGDAYISTGAGVVFAIDALNGSTRWAVRYQRSGASASNANQYRNAYQMVGQIKGWREDMVIPHGKHLVVMASDSDELIALDRRTGEFLWESPRTPYSDVPPGEYCLGVVGEGLYIGGQNIVRRYDIPSGRLRWEAKLQDSLGRGALTENAVYIPENETIVRLDLNGGKRLSQVGVFSDLPSAEPVGNLYTDGRRLLSLGMGRVYALTDLSYRLDLLTQKIKDGDVQAQLERMRLRLKENDRDGALQDLGGAYNTLLKRRRAEEAVATLCMGIDELALASRDPDKTLQLIAAMPTGAESGSDAFDEKLTAKRSELLLVALQSIAEKSLPGVAEPIIDVVPLCSEDHLLRAASAAMEATATPKDADVLKTALASPRVGLRTVAMAGLPKAFGDRADDILVGLLADGSDHIKLEAAWTLANTGDRRSLPALGQLLDSDDLKVRIRSAQALRSVTGQKLEFSAYEDNRARAEQAKAWQQWIANEGQTAKLDFPIRQGAPQIGRTLICYYSGNKVVELDADGKETWTASVPYAWGCHGLPNGHRVVASYSGKFIVEYDEKGREVWKKTGLPGAPFSVERLDNGNTLVTCSDSQKIVEIARDKSIAWEIEIAGRPMDAKRLENGNTLVALQTIGKVVEVDREGKIVWEISGQGGVISAQRLENGNTLISRQADNRVVEVNRRGEIVWSQGDLRTPYDAQRLPNGNTLIVDYKGVHEVNSKGETVWERSGNGASRVHRY